MKVAFISGPYRAATKEGISANIEAAREVAVKYWRKGYAVFAPHLNTAHFDGLCPDEVWLKGDLEILRRCDVVVMMEEWWKSEGAKAEHALALELGKEIIYEAL